MAKNSKIEWTHHTANLWHGCTKVHAGCDHCYAEILSHRWNREIWGNDKPRLEINSVWKDMGRYQKLAVAAGEVHRVFVGSMMDLFEKPMPYMDSKGQYAVDASDGSPIATDFLREKFFDEVVPASTNLQFLLLTKRPSNIVKYVPLEWLAAPPSNVMYGTSPCDQTTYDTLVKQLMQVPGKRFLSIEPLLGPIVMKSYCPSCDGLLYGSLNKRCGTCHSETILPDWVIVGGESGHEARPMNADWVRGIQEQCKDAGIPFFFKQWGEYLPINQIGGLDEPQDVWVQAKIARVLEADDSYLRLGKKRTGRKLDGVIYNEFPR